MKNLLLYSSFFLLFFTNLCIAKTVTIDEDKYTDKTVHYTVDNHYDGDGQIYTKKGDNEKIQIKIPSIPFTEIKDDGNDFTIKVRYNNKVKKIIYHRYNTSFDLNILNAQTTEIFCKKKYLVITIRFVDSSMDYSYAELFIDVNKIKNDYSIFWYGFDDFPAKGPQPLDYIKRATKQVCYKNRIEFVGTN